MAAVLPSAEVNPRSYDAAISSARLARRYTSGELEEIYIYLSIYLLFLFASMNSSKANSQEVTLFTMYKTAVPSGSKKFEWDDHYDSPGDLVGYPYGEMSF
jgi:hypothetical protein